MNLKKGLSIPWWDLTESEAGEQHWGHSLVSWGHRSPEQDTGHVVTDIHVRTSAGCGTRDTRVSVMSLAADCHVLLTHYPLSSVWLMTPIPVSGGCTRWWLGGDHFSTDSQHRHRCSPGRSAPARPAQPAGSRPSQQSPGGTEWRSVNMTDRGHNINYNNFISGLLIAGDRMSSLAPTPAAPDKTYWVWTAGPWQASDPGDKWQVSLWVRAGTMTRVGADKEDLSSAQTGWLPPTGG